MGKIHYCWGGVGQIWGGSFLPSAQGFALHPRLHHVLEPFVEYVVQVIRVQISCLTTFPALKTLGKIRL